MRARLAKGVVGGSGWCASGGAIWAGQARSLVHQRAARRWAKAASSGWRQRLETGPRQSPQLCDPGSTLGTVGNASFRPSRHAGLARSYTRQVCRRLLALLITLTLVLVGCSGSDGGDGSGDAADSPGTTTSVSAPPGQDVDADKAAAENAVLKLSDMPSGWTAEPADNDEGDPDIANGIAECLDVPVDEFKQEGPAKVESPTFNDPEEDFSIQNEVSYLADADLAKERFDLLAGDDVPGCFAEGMSAFIDEMIENPPDPENTLPKGAEIGDPKVQEMSFPNLADHTVAYRVSLPLEFSGLTFTLYVDLVGVVKGRVGTMFFFQGFDSPFDTDDAQGYVQKVVDRIVA